MSPSLPTHGVECDVHCRPVHCTGTAAKLKAFVAEHSIDAQMTEGGGVSLVYADAGATGREAAAEPATEGGAAAAAEAVLDGLVEIDVEASMGTAPGLFKRGYFDSVVTSFWPAKVVCGLANAALNPREPQPPASVEFVFGCYVRCTPSYIPPTPPHACCIT